MAQSAGRQGLLAVSGGMTAGLVASIEIGIGPVVLSWALVHTIFTLKYARLICADPPVS